MLASMVQQLHMACCTLSDAGQDMAGHQNRGVGAALNHTASCLFAELVVELVVVMGALHACMHVAAPLD